MKAEIAMPADIQTALEEMISTIKSSLVVVRGSRRRTGAGVILREDGLVLTNNHVLGKSTPFVLMDDERHIHARILSRSQDIDLAMLQLPLNSLPALPIAERSPRIGEMVFAVGHPWGQRDMVTKGIVSALINAQTRDKRNLILIRTDVSLAPGSSGGPLVNAKGQMVGINTMIVGGDQSVAIPAAVIRKYMNTISQQNNTLSSTNRKMQEKAN